MSLSNVSLLEKALKVAEAHAKSGNSRPVELVLKLVFEELKRINAEL